MLSVTVGNFSPFSELRDHDFRCPKPITARFQSERCVFHTEACPVHDSQQGTNTDFLYSHIVSVRDQFIRIVHMNVLPCPFTSLLYVDVDFISMNQTRDSNTGPLHLKPIKGNNFATHHSVCRLGNASSCFAQLASGYRMEPAISCKYGNVQFVPVHQCSHFCYFKLTLVLFFMMSSTTATKIHRTTEGTDFD